MKVINLKEEKYDVYIGRYGKGQDGYFGNPFPLSYFPRLESIRNYRLYFNYRIRTDPEFKKRVLELKDKTLGCFCKPLDCHGDIIKNYLEKIK